MVNKNRRNEVIALMKKSFGSKEFVKFIENLHENNEVIGSPTRQAIGNILHGWYSEWN